MHIRIILLLLLTSPSFAEPSATVNWLMNQPASMFDIGMLRLRDFNRNIWVPDLEKRATPKNTSWNIDAVKSEGVVYDWDKNRISVSVVFSGQPEEKVCENILKLYKDVISPIRKSGQKLTVTIFAGDFDHVNYSFSNAPRNWREEIINITDITVGIEETLNIDPNDAPDVQALKRLMGGKSLFCSGPLLTDEVSYSKYGF